MEKEFDLIHYLKILTDSKKTILLLVGVTTSIAIVVSLLLPQLYQAQATLFPIGGGQKSGGSSVMAIATQVGMGGLLGGMQESKTVNQLFAILKSQTLAERVVERNNLQFVLVPHSEVNNQPTLDQLRQTILGMVSFTEDKKSQLIFVYGTANDPKLAALVVNSYVKELANYINENTLTAAKRNRIFIQHQLERNKSELLEGGKELASFYRTNKVSNVTPKVDVDISSPEDKIEEDSGPESAIQRKTKELQEKLQATETKINQIKLVKDVPQQVYLEYLIIRRDLLSQLNIFLTQQFEMAKIDEAKEDLNFQVIDWARVPLNRYKPQRKQIVLKAFFISILIAIAYVLLREYLLRALEKFREENEGHRS